MYRNLASILIVCVFIILALGSASKTPVYQESPRIETQEKILSDGTRTITLSDYSPHDLTISTKNIQLNEKIVKRTTYSSYSGTFEIVSADYSFENTIKIFDQNLTFDISLTQSSTELGGDKIGFPVVFDFVMSNNTNGPIRIKWDEASYIDQSGLSHKLIKTNARLLEKDKPTGDIVIPPRAKIEEIIYPSDLIYYSSGRYGGWRSVSLIDSVKQNEKVSVFIPVSIKDQIVNYNFTFMVNDSENTSSKKYSGTTDGNNAPPKSNELGCGPGQSYVFKPGESKGRCVDDYLGH